MKLIMFVQSNDTKVYCRYWKSRISAQHSELVSHNLSFQFPICWSSFRSFCVVFDVVGLESLLRLGNPADHAETVPEQSGSVLLSMTVLIPTAPNLSAQASD